MNEKELITNWVEVKQKSHGCSHYTAYAYQLYLCRLLEYLTAIGQTFMSVQIGPLEDYAGRELHAQGLKPQTRKVCIAAIRGFFAWLRLTQIRADNPAAGLRTPKVGGRLPRSMSLADAEKLLMQPGISDFWATRDTTLIAVLLGTGCRVSGLVALNERDLLFTPDPSGRERLTVRLLEKGKKERLVPVPWSTCLLVRAYLGGLDRQPVERTTAAGERVLFVTRRNSRVAAHDFYGEATRLTKRGAWFILQRHCARAGIASEFSHPHALRHLYGTELAEEDADLLTRKILMGHARTETVEVYTHLALRKLAAIVDKANPLTKMRTPVDGLLMRQLRRPGA